MKRVCVHYRRLVRQPEIRWGVRHVKKNFIRAAMLSFVPSAIDDVVLHHANLDLGEFVHVGVDTVVINAIGVVLSFASKM
jgi:pectate lyase